MRLNDATLRRWLWPIVGLGALAFLVFTAASLFLSPQAQVTPTPTARPTQTPPPTITPWPTWTPLPTRAPGVSRMRTTAAAVGETIQESNLTFTAKALSPRIAPTPNPAAPSRWILLDLTIENTGDAVVSINSAREFILKDDTEQIYKINPAIVAAAGGATPDVDLAPGETIRAQVGFEVPTAARGLVLNFAADKFKAGRILVELP